MLPVWQPGHSKAECRAFAKWKADKDEARKKAGLPPFKPRGVSSLDAEGQGQPSDYGDYEGQLGGDPDVGMLGCGICDPGCDAVGVGDEDDDLETVGDYDFEFDFGFDENTTESDEIIFIDERPSVVTTPTAAPIAYQNRYAALDEEEDDDEVTVDVLGIETPPQSRVGASLASTSPWSVGSTESLADRMHREQQELLNRIAQINSPGTRRPLIPGTLRVATSQTSSETASETVLPPPGMLPRERSVEPLESTLMRCLPKSQAESQVRVTSVNDTDANEHSRKGSATMLCSAETQTTISLDHCVRSITWIPMPDNVEPVHDEDSDDDVEEEQAGPDEDEGVNGIDCISTDEEILNFGAYMTTLLMMVSFIGMESPKAEPYHPANGEKPTTTATRTTVTWNSPEEIAEDIEQSESPFQKFVNPISKNLLNLVNYLSDFIPGIASLDEDFPEGHFNDDPNHSTDILGPENFENPAGKKAEGKEESEVRGGRWRRGGARYRRTKSDTPEEGDKEVYMVAPAPNRAIDTRGAPKDSKIPIKKFIRKQNPQGYHGGSRVAPQRDA